MKRGKRTPSRAVPAALALAASALLLGACGSDDDAEDSGAAPTAPPVADSFPEPSGTIEDLVAEVGLTGETGVFPSGGVYEPGNERFGFAVVDVGGAFINEAKAAIYAAHGPSGKALGPFPARIESLATEPEFVAQTTVEEDPKVVYVADVPFDETGEWRLAAVVDRGDGQAAVRIPSAVVKERKDIPDVGEPAPSVETPTLAEVGGDIEAIDTRVPPSSMHEDNLKNVLGKEPVVLLFATPKLCQTRVCGPVVDVAEQVKAEYGDAAAFIHQEIYEDNVVDPKNLWPPVEEYGLFTEPWLFVLDRNGDVATRIEGAFSVDELENALKPLVR